MRYHLWATIPPVLLFTLLAVLVVVTPAPAAELIHRNGFGGKEPYWVRGDANIHFEEKAHSISDDHARNALTSEYIKIEANPAPGATSVEYAHYYYDTAPAAISNDLVARVWIKSYREGAQLKARVVLPKERDPKNPEVPLTTLIPGDTYTRPRTWQQLTIPNSADLLRKHHALLHAKLGRAVDLTGAYIDQLVLNVYCGAGVSEVWIDDLEIGPVMGRAAAPAARQARPVGLNKGRIPQVEFSNGDILVDDEPFFMIGIRHSDTPLEVLRNALINTIWFPEIVKEQVYEEAIAAKFFLVPSLPLPESDWDPSRPRPTDPEVFDRDAKLVAEHLRKFLSSDAVLMWNLGTQRTKEQVGRVARLADVVRTFDPKRPRCVDLWDGYRAYSNYVEAIGAYRFPLFSSLELDQYREWLAQRKALTAPSKLNWTWIQTHLPEWYVRLNTGKSECEKFDEPIGPHPEQIRILTYLSLAAGYRGLAYWSDRFLAESHHGKARLLEIALLNAELELLKPALMAAQEPAKWYPTNHPNVKAAVIRGAKELIVLPVWLGSNAQHCPDQATLSSLTMTIPLVPEGAVPWLITPVAVDEVKSAQRVPSGTQITISEFDTTAAIVFTNDVGLKGKVVRWQHFTRNQLGPTAAGWARQQAVEQYNKTLQTYQLILQAGGPPIPEANDLFVQARKAISLASQYTDNAQPEVAFREARRAQRPLRTLMRACWEKATKSLDTPTASPYAASFYSLPRHWLLARHIQASRPGGNALPHGSFELRSKVERKEGAAINSLPGWMARGTFLDDVAGAVSIVNSEGLEDTPPPPPLVDPSRMGLPGRPIVSEADLFAMKPKPQLGNQTLRLAMYGKPQEDGTTGPIPQALERSYVAVDSPQVEFPPGTWVRISFWLKVQGTAATADGVLVYDSALGEALALRNRYTNGWKKFHLYRQVPETGKIGVTVALTGPGRAFVDEMMIEPMTSGGVTNFRPPAIDLPQPLPLQDDQRKLGIPRETDLLPPPRIAR